MLMPSIFRDNLLDDFFDFPFDRYGTGSLMNTYIKDTDNGYEVTINMPGVKKEYLKAKLLIPKKEAVPEVEERKYIAIEG